MDTQRKTQVLNRLKSIQGHLRGVQRMVEEDQYCIDVIRQMTAVQRALDKVNAIVLENHLQTCVARALRGDEPEERERVIAELLQLYEGGASVGLNRQVEPVAAEGPGGTNGVLLGRTGESAACPHCGSVASLGGGNER